jgi:hypothetical protein
MLQEVTVRLRFNNECLGAVRKKDCNEMLKDPDGRVMLMATWWQAVIGFAAKVLNRHQDLVKQIEWDPVVTATPKLFRRYYEPGKYTVHEAFLKGDVITVNCVIPSGLNLEDLRTLMQMAGRYKGISPYKPERKYGTFDVLEICPFLRAVSSPEDNATVDVR